MTSPGAVHKAQRSRTDIVLRMSLFALSFIVLNVVYRSLVDSANGWAEWRRLIAARADALPPQTGG